MILIDWGAVNIAGGVDIEGAGEMMIVMMMIMAERG